MCEGTTKTGAKCQNKPIAGSMFCRLHQGSCAACAKGNCAQHAKGCNKCGKVHRTTNDNATCSRTNQKIGGVFCDKTATGANECKFEVREGKLCGATTAGTDHPYCSRHGQNRKGMIPIYDVSDALPCDFMGCSTLAVGGTNLCAAHTGLCTFGLGTNAQCGLRIASKTGMCSLKHLPNLIRCRCGSCNEPSIAGGLCITHKVQGCQQRWAFYQANMQKQSEIVCKNGKCKLQKSKCDNCGNAII
jgi:hypothetical protein